MSNDKDIITKTNDGYVVEVFANVKLNFDKESVDIAEGISILELKTNLTEEEQFLVYKEIVEKMEYNPVIMKVSEKEATLKNQLRALLRSAKYGDLSIAFSKISSVMDLIEFKEILEECKSELEKEEMPYKKHIKIGVIVEIPSVALMSYQLAKECDFFFIETNSLTKYTFGNKKENEKRPELFTKFQPAIINLVQQAIEGAHDAGIFCGICGEVIENELYIPLLIGLGIDELAMDSRNILNVRKIINKLDKSDCKELVEEVLQLRTIEDIENKLKQFWNHIRYVKE